MKKSDKICTLIFDEMKLKPNVLYDKKNDSIVQFVDAGMIEDKQLRTSTIALCDQSSMNISSNNKLVGEPKKKCLEFEQTFDKLFLKSTIKKSTVCDPPHLLKDM